MCHPARVTLNLLVAQVVPVMRELPDATEETHALLNPYSLTSFDLALEQKA